jgi:hypothetical protein
MKVEEVLIELKVTREIIFTARLKGLSFIRAS